MSKEYLEAFESIMKIYGNTNSLEGTYNYFLIIKQALQRLESVDNANPSEALKLAELLECDLQATNDLVTRTINGYDYLDILETIKQALLKAQEPKKYLKWEDLKFKEKSNTIPVRMGDNVYKMTYLLYENEGFIRLEDCQRIYLELFANEKKFFNDLHLERVE